MSENIMYLGIFETHVHVSDLERSAAFYEHTLGLTFAHGEESRRARFYWIGKSGEAMLGIWETEPAHIVRQHFAFRTTPDRLRPTIQQLQDRGVQVRNFFNIGVEPLVFAWMPAVSIYFEDPDGHSLEFIAMLPGASTPELGILSWQEWNRRSRRD